MNFVETKRLLRKINHASTRIGLGVMLLLISPMVYVALCASRRMEMSKINAYGTAWVIVCIAIGLFGIGRGITSFLLNRTKIQKPIELQPTAAAYMEEYKKKRTKRLFIHVSLGCVVALLSSFFIITITTIGREDYKLLEHSYYATFLLSGYGILIIISSWLRFYMIGQIQYITLEQEDEPKKQGFFEKVGHMLLLHKRILAFLIIAAIGVGGFLVMSSGTWYLQPYISTIPVVDLPKHQVSYDADTGIYSIQKEPGKDFKILQLTDIHIGGSAFSYSKDLKALQAVYALVNETKPDLVVVTGDFVFPLGIESFSFNNYTPILQLASFFRNMGVCWAFTYGNHDTEFVASHSEKELDDLFSKFSYDTTKSLLYTDKQPDITGRSNQVILIKNKDGSINQALYMIDSNSYSSAKLNDYDYIHDDQVDWYEQSVKELSKQQGTTISSLVFTHIPLQEYKTAYELHKKGNKEEVTYYFGEVGEAGESICCSEHRSQLFDRIVDLKSTKAIFCGHDHYNNIALGYKGVKLVYGMSIDYLAMHKISKETKQRGGTLISLHDDSTFDLKQIPLTSIGKAK